MIDVSWMGVLLAAVVNMIVGFVWYGPLFGKKWLELSKVTPDQIAEGKAKGQKGMAKEYILTLVGSLITAFVLYYFIAFAFGFKQVSGVWEAIFVAFWAWLGFVLPISLNSVLWAKSKTWGLWCFDNVQTLVSYAIMAAILSGFM